MLLLAGIAVLALIVVTAILFATGALEGGTEPEPTQALYEKKPFVFDRLNELVLYRDLVELFGDTYFIFPQISYGRLVQTRPGVHLMYRTKFDKKVADFVLCDKEKAVAKLVIELDGRSHLSEKRIQRDKDIDALMANIGLPILHIRASNISKEWVKAEVQKALD